MEVNKNRKSITDTDKWGLLVCFGTVITFVAGIGHVNSFGLIYKDFIVDTHSTAKSLTTAHGVFAMMLAVGGIILNIISKRISLKLGGLIGSALFILGSFTTIIISNANQLPITFGMLQGVGFGMMVPVSYATLNYYYVKRRTTVMSICKAIQGLILMWYPHLLKKILSLYGFRGTLLLLSGISLHTIPGMVVMQNKNKTQSIIRIANDVGKRNDITENLDLLNHAVNNQLASDNNVTQRSRKCNVTRISLELLDTLNVKVLKDKVYCNICVGQSFVNFSDLTFFILLPMLLFQFDFDTAQVAAVISVCAGADVAGRFALAVISSLLIVNTRLLFYFSTLFTLIFRIAILQVRSFAWVVVLTAVLGVLRAWLHVASPLVISDHVSHHDFPGAYALFMLSTGVVNIIFAPLIGQLKDAYQDYLPAFHALTVCCVPCLIFWPIEYALK